jgi:hypothetical protein
MREHFIDRRFSKGSLALIEQANEIVDQYRAQGFVLTLRQLYYQFVARGLIPNQQSEYKRLGSVINDARLAGLLDWDMIEDRTRNLEDLPRWDTPQDLIYAISEQYRSDIWSDQSHRPEVWIEKEALVGVVEPVCRELRVPYFACRGYGSQSELWRAGHRFRRHVRKGQHVIVLHFGDHDPSGIDMTRDNADRLALFSRMNGAVEVRRLALNMDQVEQYNPPPNPAKATDARFAGYEAIHGDESWELDALEPQLISDLVRENVEALIDRARWNAVIAAEETARGVMKNVADSWEDVTNQYSDIP